MVLTNCAARAAPLQHPAKQCGRCKTLYCGAACQKQHWDAGHKDLCKKIKKAGGAEQYYANNKYAEAVSVAAEACAEETKGQTCYICTQALHWKTKEGLVRGCSCRGTAGFAHVSCLAEQAKILVAEAEENNWNDERTQTRWGCWDTCSLCEQAYHGVVACALGWACWKTYLDRPKASQARSVAINVLTLGLKDTADYEGALSVQEAELSMLRRVGMPGDIILMLQGNVAATYESMGRIEEALLLKQEAYSGLLQLKGEEDFGSLVAAQNYVSSLCVLGRFEEAKAVLHKMTPAVQRVLEEKDELALKWKWNYASVLYKDGAATLDDVGEAVTTLEDLVRTTRRVFGGAHPLTVEIECDLQMARAALRARGGVDALREAVEAMTPPGRA